MPRQWKPSVTWAKKCKRACEKTIADYKELGWVRGDCPLCSFDGGYAGVCAKCPWKVFGTVTKMAKELFKTHGKLLGTRPCLGYSRDPLPKRLARLRGWVKRCDNIIEKGGK